MSLLACLALLGELDKCVRGRNNRKEGTKAEVGQARRRSSPRSMVTDHNYGARGSLGKYEESRT